MGSSTPSWRRKQGGLHLGEVARSSRQQGDFQSDLILLLFIIAVVRPQDCFLLHLLNFHALLTQIHKIVHFCMPQAKPLRSPEKSACIYNYTMGNRGGLAHASLTVSQNIRMSALRTDATSSTYIQFDMQIATSTVDSDTCICGVFCSEKKKRNFSTQK